MLKNILFITLFFLTAISFNGCCDTKENSCEKTTIEEVEKEEEAVAFNQGQKDFLYNLFNTEYLWYDKVPQDVDTTTFNESDEMIDALRFSPTDHWSYSQNMKEYENTANQISGGFGCKYSKAQIRSMDYESPCETSGLKRGDIVKKINGEKASSESYSNAVKNLDVESIFSVLRGEIELDIPITPTDYSFKSSKHQILTNTAGTKIGHIILNQFTSSSIDELDTAFNAFKEVNISELVVDLRYNGGGSLTTTSVFMDKIAAYNNDEKTQFYLNFNDKNQNKNDFYYFDKDDNSIDIDRVFFLTTDGSASASEVMVNALKPYMDVKVIGSQTHGKPVGMTGRKKDDYIYWLINFTIYNVNSEGDYFDGIAVDCQTDDDLFKQRTEINDSMLSEAMSFIENGSCTD